MKIKNSEKVETKKIVDLDEDDTLVKAQAMVPEKWYQKLGDIAHEKGMSRGSLIREALREWFEKIEKPIEMNPEAKISDEDLNEILDACTTYFGGFEIDGEKGFVETMKANGFKLKDLAKEQFDRVVEKLNIGYRGYFSTPDTEEWLAKFEDLEPTEEQLEQLTPSEETEEEIEEEE